MTGHVVARKHVDADYYFTLPYLHMLKPVEGKVDALVKLKTAKGKASLSIRVHLIAGQQNRDTPMRKN